MKGIKNGGRLTDRQVGFLLVVPGLAVFAAIILYPFVDAVLMSFTDRSLLYPDYDWVWLENYVKVFKAILLNQGFKGSELLRGLTLVNWIIPGIAIGFLWSWIFNGQYGVLNGLLTNLGILDKGVSWMGQTQTALLCVVIARSWQMLPWYMAFLLGGLQGVSTDQIGNLQHFDLPWTMTEGGPARATTTLSIEVYTTAFKNWDMGKAATVGTIWALLLACFSFVYLRQVNESD